MSLVEYIRLLENIEAQMGQATFIEALYLPRSGKLPHSKPTGESRGESEALQ